MKNKKKKKKRVGIFSAVEKIEVEFENDNYLALHVLFSFVFNYIQVG